jgi:predicted transposase YbfD/YdcC
MAESSKSFKALEFLKRFEGIEDPRIERRKVYPLDEILFLVVCATISGCHAWDEIADFGKIKLSWLQRYLPYSKGTPSHDTLNRVMGLLDYRKFEEFFISWVEEFIRSSKASLEGKVINIDGKKMRSSVDKRLQQIPKEEGGKSAVHLVEAWCSDLNLCLGQYKTEDKSNEIRAIPALLDLLDLQGSVVTIDAMGCQKEIAKKIVESQANYILGLKENHPKLLEEVRSLFNDQHAEGRPQNEVMKHSVNENLGHGRLETRTCRVLPATLLPQAILDEWEGLNVIIEIESERFIASTENYSYEYRYYLSSAMQSPEWYNKCVREHWGIENKLHWTMDVTFDEDKSRKRDRNAAQNFAAVTRLALNLLKNNEEGKNKVSVNRRITKCAISDEYREKTLKL